MTTYHDQPPQESHRDKMAGPESSMKEGWTNIRSVIAMEDPTPLGQYLVCGRDKIAAVPPEVIKATSGHIHLTTNQPCTLNQSARGNLSLNAGSMPKAKESDRVSSDSGSVPGIRCEMKGFMEQCVERHVELPKIPRERLTFAAAPSLDEKELRGADYDNLGELSTIAAKVLMNILFAARMSRHDLLQPATSLAREVSRWTLACDKKVCATSTRQST